MLSYRWWKLQIEPNKRNVYELTGRTHDRSLKYFHIDLATLMHNDALHNLYSLPNVIGVIKSRGCENQK